MSDMGASAKADRAAGADAPEPVPVSATGSIPCADVTAELHAIIERLRGKVPPTMIAALMPSLLDQAYNAEYDRKKLSAWESPEYRPYCLSCSTMRRMEHRDYGYQCSVCGAKAEAAQAMSAREGQDRNGLGGDSPASAVAEGHAPNCDCAQCWEEETRPVPNADAP